MLFWPDIGLAGWFDGDGMVLMENYDSSVCKSLASLSRLVARKIEPSDQQQAGIYAKGGTQVCSMCS